MPNPNLDALAAAGTSAWLDDLSRQRLDTGNLADLVEELRVVGVTTNPAIFSVAMTTPVCRWRHSVSQALPPPSQLQRQ